METEAAVCGVLCVVLAAVPCGCWQQSRDYLIQSLLELCVVLAALKCIPGFES